MEAWWHRVFRFASHRRSTLGLPPPPPRLVLAQKLPSTTGQFDHHNPMHDAGPLPLQATPSTIPATAGRSLTIRGFPCPTANPASRGGQSHFRRTKIGTVPIGQPETNFRRHLTSCHARGCGKKSQLLDAPHTRWKAAHNASRCAPTTCATFLSPNNAAPQGAGAQWGTAPIFVPAKMGLSPSTQSKLVDPPPFPVSRRKPIHFDTLPLRCYSLRPQQSC